MFDPGAIGITEEIIARLDRACLLIDKRDTIVNDVDAPIRAAWGTEMVSFR